MSRAYIREMRAAGIRMLPTSPLWHLHTISYRNHRKISVIDGRIGYTGGMNIGQEHLDGGRRLRVLARYPGAHRRRGCRRVAGRVCSGLVQRREGGSVCPRLLPGRCDGDHARETCRSKS